MHGVLIGYGRTSTTEQHAGLEAQRRDLKAAGCKKLFEEQISSMKERPQLQAEIRVQVIAGWKKAGLLPAATIEHMVPEPQAAR